MNVGWVGLGKLGLPCALALEAHAGVELFGYDTDDSLYGIVNGAVTPTRIEEGLPELLAETKMVLCDEMHQVVRATDRLLFVAVPTPHAPEYGGEKPMPELRADFDYQYLEAAVKDISQAADEQNKQITLVVISTVLPGTLRRVILPGLSDNVTLLYNPFFIAMGTTIRDFLHPEFILVGCEYTEEARPLLGLYDRLHDGDYHSRVVSLEEAELTKVAYNTFISLKITFANTLLEICDLIGANVDQVTGSLALATDRVISPAYLAGGMGDGGACHPRDNIAMSWLARSLGLAADPFEFVTKAREAQSGWLALRVAHEAHNTSLPVILLGKAYKPASDLTYGSPALLLAHQLTELGVEFRHWDPYIDGTDPTLVDKPALFVVCTKHPGFVNGWYPAGSMILDPHRYMPDIDGVEVVQLGAGWRDQEGTD